MEGFVGEEQEFVSDAGLDREPVEVEESRGDVLPGLGACENPGNCQINKQIKYLYSNYKCLAYLKLMFLQDSCCSEFASSWLIALIVSCRGGISTQICTLVKVEVLRFCTLVKVEVLRPCT